MAGEAVPADGTFVYVLCACTVRSYMYCVPADGTFVYVLCACTVRSYMNCVLVCVVLMRAHTYTHTRRRYILVLS